MPGAWTEGNLKGPERIKILLAEPVAESGPPGHVVEAGKNLVVTCGSGALKILKLQRAGATVQDAETFVRGYPLKRGNSFLQYVV